MTFLVAADRERARAFYGGTLGLKYLSEDPFALVYELSGGVMLRISPGQEMTPARHTVLGWEVPDIRAKMAGLKAAGVAFTQYGFPGQDADGLWDAGNGHLVAWFQDPDGNVLSLAQLS